MPKLSLIKKLWTRRSRTGVSDGVKTLNAAGSLLSDGNGRLSGQFLRERLRPAHIWLHDSEHNADAGRLLARFNE